MCVTDRRRYAMLCNTLLILNRSWISSPMFFSIPMGSCHEMLPRTHHAHMNTATTLGTKYHIPSFVGCRDSLSLVLDARPPPLVVSMSSDCVVRHLLSFSNHSLGLITIITIFFVSRYTTTRPKSHSPRKD